MIRPGTFSHSAEATPGVDARTLSVLDALYESALDPSLQEPWLERLRDAIAVAGVSYMPPSIGGGPWYSVGFSQEFRAAYEEHFAQIDPWLPSLRRKLAQGDCSVLGTSGALLAHDEFVRTEFFNDFFLPHGFDDGFGAVLAEGDGPPLSLHVVRKLGAPTVEPWQLSVLEQLVPHLLRFDRIRALSPAPRPALLAQAALDALAEGVLFVDARSAFVWSNRAATEMLGGPHAALTVRHGALSARTPPATRALARALHDAVSTRPGLSSSVPLPRGEARGPWVLTVVPVQATLAERHALGLARAVLFLRDPEALPRPPAALLRTLYGLTPAEARLALEVGRGVAPREAAEALGIAWNTARVHLARVFAKTSTSRQPALVRLVSSLAPAVRAAE